MERDGSNRQRLTDSKVVSNPAEAVAEDGRKIHTHRRVYYSTPSWSPEGTQVAFVSDGDVHLHYGTLLMKG